MSRRPTQNLSIGQYYNGSTDTFRNSLSRILPYTGASYACWVNIDSSTTGGLKQVLFTADGHEILTSSNQIGIYGSSFVGVTIPYDTWQHIVVTRGGTGVGQYKMYLNGSLVISTTRSDTNNGTKLTLASKNGLAKFTGGITNVQLYDRVLNQQEVTYIYTGYPAANPVFLDGMDGLGTIITDLSGNGNNLAFGGAWRNINLSKVRIASLNRFTINTTSLSFNGITTVADAGVISALNLPNSFWISAWVNPSNTAGVQRVISSMNHVATNGWAFGINVGKLRFTKRNVADIDSNLSNISANVWTHVAACVISDNSVDFYVNGVFKENVVSATPINLGATNRTTLGCLYSGSGYIEYYSGLINNARIHLGVATGYDVIRDMRIPSDRNGSYSLWLLNEGSGNVALDKSGNSNNATITNGSWVSNNTPYSMRNASLGRSASV